VTARGFVELLSFHPEIVVGTETIDVQEIIVVSRRGFALPVIIVDNNLRFTTSMMFSACRDLRA